MNSFKTNGYVPRLTDGNPPPKREVARATPRVNPPAKRTGVIFLRYIFLSLIFILLGAAIAHACISRDPDACAKVLDAHFKADGTSKILFATRVFVIRALPLSIICLGSLTFFSGGVSTIALSFCSAVFGVGACTVLTLQSPYAAAYILWSALLLALDICCAVFARRFFAFLFVERRGYSNVKGLFLFLGVCLGFLTVLFAASLLYTFAIYSH